jgi:hypothetical protein
MQKYLIGLAVGVALAIVFVRFDLAPPAIFGLPEKLQKNIVSTAVEGDLYDLDADAGVRTRALEVYFKNRAGDAASLDAEAGHPFLSALHRARAAREALQVSQQWTAFDTVLDKPALRATLETKHGLTETEALKRAMLFEALDEKPFLKRWLAAQGDAPTAETLRAALAAAAAANAKPKD